MGNGQPTRILFVNACVNRDKSRTARLAGALLSHFDNSTIDEIILEDIGLKGLDSETLVKRNKAVSENDFSDPIFDYARQMISADIVIMASPYWESMFNSFLKIYIENVSVPQLVFSYDEYGAPIGNAKGKLYYVTTRGGPVSDENDLGCIAIKTLGTMFGFKEIRIISASGLDLIGNDPENILDMKMSTIDELI